MYGLPRRIATILDFMKFEVTEWDFPVFLATLPVRFCRTTLASFQALDHMKPQRERSDGVGPCRLGGISFRAHGKEGLTSLIQTFFVRVGTKRSDANFLYRFLSGDNSP